SATQSSYGGPLAFQRLIDAAHALGLAVILDVVHNHVGASGTAALLAYGPYFTHKHETPWGAGLNVDDEQCDAVREWGCQGAAWADDFHHALRTLLTGDTDGWYAEFDSLALLGKAFKRPHVHDGTYSAFRKRRFGASADDVPPERFVVFSADHDQVGNRALGD